MPSLSGSFPLGMWQLAALAVLVVCAVAGSVYLARKHLNDDTGLPDAVFWDSFAGLAVVVPAVILPSLASPWAGMMLGLLAAGTAVAAYRLAPGLISRQGARRTSREAVTADEAAAALHRRVLERWQRYELDPGYCIDFPAMSDPRQPETAALIKAMKAAERLSAGHRRDGNDAGYVPAVRRLEQALAEAERAAGVNLNASLLS
ncbi:hypothetical protein E5206_02715 [Arthrobacter sp. PAMC25564]|uniref:hypothetical protein n=1 Tax=Arthrobacter sp. PAMC25564 TaxID=2565366 RepID=UPI0010A28790|nr:hypothetical protein [Arthrobacter sp. PAMC25564]QCB95980.1 hypothetical protein E5206_02715 [Arthrobacter sp. PAMC25564]